MCLRPVPFLADHFGFREKMAADGFASLHHDESTVNVIYLRRGISQLPEGFRDERTSGAILAFTVDNIAEVEARFRKSSVNITMPLREEEWGEKLFQVTDPNGIIIQCVEWATH
nr:VOC family protein [Mesorhizobium alhagi]